MTRPDPRYEEISVVDTARLLSNGSGLRLIDCREDDEMAICILPDAEAMPLTRFHEFFPARFEDPASGTPAGKPIIVYCHHGVRSLNLARFLRARGVPHVWSMRGGIEAWSSTVDPSVPRY